MPAAEAVLATHRIVPHQGLIPLLLGLTKRLVAVEKD